MEKTDIRLQDSRAGFTVIHRFNAGSNAERHFHPYWEILYLVSGTRSFFYENKTFDISDGDLLLVKQGVLHRAVNPPGVVCELYNIFFDADRSEEHTAFFQQLLPLLEACFSRFGPVLHIPHLFRYSVISFYDAVMREFSARKKGYIVLAHSIITQFAVEVLRLPRLVSAAASGKMSGSAVSAARRRVSAVLEYLSEHYADPLSLAAVAEYFCVSETHLSRTFRKETHFSFVEYLNGLRITRACRLLEMTDCSVTDIAFRCGFGSITQFGRCFRSFTGKSPLAYRKLAGYTRKSVYDI